MRIRNRQVRVPFPLFPVTHSDPNLINRSPVMVQLNGVTTASSKSSCTRGPATAPSRLSGRPQQSDQPLPSIGKPTNGSDGGAQYWRQRKKQDSLVKDGRGEEGGGQKGNDSRKGSFSCSKTPAETFSSLSPPKLDMDDGRWSELGEKAIPLKKRRGSFKNAMNNNDDNGKKNPKVKIMRSRMKAKMDKKCSKRDDSGEGKEEEEKEVAREAKPEASLCKKRRARGSALVEGSRCSRVNGRGWRCCQQTLVGYSLCEHHLGKARIKSMNSEKNKPNDALKNNMTVMPQSEKQTPKGNDEKKPLMITKRMKLGVVKARSISSLLGQTSTENVAVAEDN